MYMWHNHVASHSNIMAHIFMKRFLEALLNQFEFQISRQSILSVITPITRANRKSWHITKVNLLSFSKIVAVFKIIFPSKIRITFPKHNDYPSWWRWNITLYWIIIIPVTSKLTSSKNRLSLRFLRYHYFPYVLVYMFL